MQGRVVATARKGDSHEKIFGGNNLSNHSHQHTNNRPRQRPTSLSNAAPPPPPPPPPPPLPLLPPVEPSPRARDISSRQKIHALGHGAPIGNAVAAEHESLPATTTTTTTTITTTNTTTTTAAVIAALASECCLQLSGEGSSYGGRSGHLVPPPSHPWIVNNHLHRHERLPYRRRCHRYTRGGSSRLRAEKPGCVWRRQTLRVR